MLDLSGCSGQVSKRSDFLAERAALGPIDDGLELVRNVRRAFKIKIGKRDRRTGHHDFDAQGVE